MAKTWQETVTPTPSHSESVSCPHCGEEFGQEGYVEVIRSMQAEISFKAGIKEVVDYWQPKLMAAVNPMDTDFWNEWAAFLKSHGIEESQNDTAK